MNYSLYLTNLSNDALRTLQYKLLQEAEAEYSAHVEAQRELSRALKDGTRDSFWLAYTVANGAVGVITTALGMPLVALANLILATLPLIFKDGPDIAPKLRKIQDALDRVQTLHLTLLDIESRLRLIGRDVQRRLRAGRWP